MRNTASCTARLREAARGGEDRIDAARSASARACGPSDRRARRTRGRRPPPRAASATAAPPAVVWSSRQRRASATAARARRALTSNESSIQPSDAAISARSRGAVGVDEPIASGTESLAQFESSVAAVSPAARRFDPQPIAGAQLQFDLARQRLLSRRRGSACCARRRRARRPARRTGGRGADRTAPSPTCRSASRIRARALAAGRGAGAAAVACADAYWRIRTGR